MLSLRLYIRTLTVVIATALATVGVYAQSGTTAVTSTSDPAVMQAAMKQVTTPSDSVKKAKSPKKPKIDKKKVAAETTPKGIEEPGLSPQRRFKVEGGVLKEITPTAAEKILGKDTITTDKTDVTTVPGKDTTVKPLKGDAVKLSPEEKEADGKDDTSTVRYSALFRDTIPLSRMTAISLIAPGFSQLYNKQAWKIPILYGVTGGLTFLGFQQNKKYKEIKKEYNSLVAENAEQSRLDPVQSQMIRYNTARTVFFVGAIASYLYFLCDGVLNYQGPNSTVKKATTLSTLCPGAGQLYNKSYWKVPIVVGAFATMGFVIDWNARGYTRYRKAYDQVIAGQPDEFEGRYTAEYLKDMKNNFRRNRDLCIILTGALYLLNIVDAHVDAHLKDYDISDDLAIKLEPTLIQSYTMNKSINGVGMALKFTF